MMILFAIILFLFLFENNAFFCLIMCPIVHLYMRCDKIRDEKKKNNILPKVPSMPSKGVTSLLKLYAIGFVRYYDYRLGLIPSHHLRHLLYRKVYMMQLDKSAVIYYGAQIRKPFKIKIGKGSIIGDCAILDGRNGIEIGDNVTFASNVSIWTEQHDHRDPYFRCETQHKEKVVIGDRAWIGPNTIVLHSVNIGTGAVVAAGAVVTKEVTSFSIVGGIPARVIGKRNANLSYDRDGHYCPFL